MELTHENWKVIDETCASVEETVCEQCPNQTSLSAELLKRIGSKLLSTGTSLGRIASK